MMKGRVIRGEGISKAKGYATANLEAGAETNGLRSGVYAARALLNSAYYDAALVIHESVKKAEVYFIGYDGPDFYGATIEVNPIQKVSEVIGFDSLEELREKIAEDVELVKAVLQQRS